MQRSQVPNNSSLLCADLCCVRGEVRVGNTQAKPFKILSAQKHTLEMCEQNQAMEGKSSIWFGAIFMMIHINAGWILFLCIAMTISFTAGIPPAFPTALCQRIHPSGLSVLLSWTSRITSGFSCLFWRTGPRKALCPFNYYISWRKPLTQAVTL